MQNSEGMSVKAKLKELTRQFKLQGFKVWSNGKD